MIVAIHQPNYIPWLGYFDKIRRSDVFVFLDHVQFVRNDFQNRNRIKTSSGARWLSLPCVHTGQRQRIIDVALCDESDWRTDQLNMLDNGYSNAPYYAEIRRILESEYGKPNCSLADMNI